ncbi:NUDIX domain-containing protein [Streptococcus loxodontisalivarius]|uniref:ADP-ribose pyrophosphatase YjhB (NUDIX family) n=1 Tax=Streptococcus loxodontisalivarius TaxID=1349415 RepID=A0ABS2PS76_9STRE|nr:NUDIX hydrolase [Streptococcus loxodontisalivarius]MBM7642888.1 ADP-ribose pyrophosphatase YjhB (NUDIX family) [Streptococcus loxodontisalivarius]
MSRDFESTGSEEEFLKIYKEVDSQKYPRPSVTVDSVIFRYCSGQVQLLLIKRKNHPFQGKYALSGGFVDEQEDLDQAVMREVFEETHVQLDKKQIEQLLTIGTPHRDPRAWTISVAYLCYLHYEDGQKVEAGDDAASTHWISLKNTDGQIELWDGESQISQEDLAFDHWQIIETAVTRIRGRLEYYPTILQIMPEEETLSAFRLLFASFNPDYAKMDSTNFLRRFKHIFEKTGRKKATRTKKAATYTYTIKTI